MVDEKLSPVGQKIKLLVSSLRYQNYKHQFTIDMNKEMKERINKRVLMIRFKIKKIKMLPRTKYQCLFNLGNLNLQNSINKQDQLGPFDFAINIKVRQAILGKEMMFHKETKLMLENLFLPFDKFVPKYKNAIKENEVLPKEAILMSDGSDHEIC